MNSSWRRKWILSIWRGLPSISIFALLLLPQMFVLQSTSLAQIIPPLPLLALYYWAMEHPRRIGWILPLLAGLAYDVLHDLPFMSAALWLFYRLLAAAGRRDIHDQGFVVTWAFGSIGLLLLMLSQWLMLALYHQRLVPIVPVLVQWGVGALLYPAMHAFLFALERRFHKRYWFVLKAV